MSNSSSAKKRDRVSVFIGSSVEGLGVARRVQGRFEHDDLDCVLWEQGVFRPSRTSIESLEEAVQNFDFAVLILTSDDMELSRGEIKPSIRDNVLFEFGFFMGALGRRRVFGISPRSELKLPSDLRGLTFLDYDPTRFQQHPDAAVATACNRIRDEILGLGSR